MEVREHRKKLGIESTFKLVDTCAAEFEAYHWQQLDRLNVLRPDDMPHATAFIAQMQALIAELLDRRLCGHKWIFALHGNEIGLRLQCRSLGIGLSQDGQRP